MLITQQEPTHCATIRNMVEAHPEIFNNSLPRLSSAVPVGWRRLLDQFCVMLKSLCDADQLAQLEFEQISEKYGRLHLDFRFASPLSEDQRTIIDARLFAMSNRSVFSCFSCGELVSDLDAVCSPMLCKAHRPVNVHRAPP